MRHGVVWEAQSGACPNHKLLAPDSWNQLTQINTSVRNDVSSFNGRIKVCTNYRTNIPLCTYIYRDICRSKSTEITSNTVFAVYLFFVVAQFEYLQSEFMNSQHTKMDHPFLVPTQLWINHVTMLVAPKKNTSKLVAPSQPTSKLLHPSNDHLQSHARK